MRQLVQQLRLASGDLTTEDVVTSLFQSFDRDGDGAVSRSEALSRIVFILVSQDADEDGRISREEFHQWNAGFNQIARERGRTDAYRAYKDALFSSWDADGDGYLTIHGCTTGVASSFAGADRQSPGQLDIKEFGSIDFMRGFQATAE